MFPMGNANGSGADIKVAMLVVAAMRFVNVELELETDLEERKL